MDSQDMRMCNSGSPFAGGTVDHNHEVYDEDCFGDILNILDFPMENVEGDSLAEDWASKLGPIPSEVFRELLPPVSHIGNGNGSSMDLPSKNAKKSQLKQQATFFEENPIHRAFEPLSPDSVLESRSSSSSRKDISYGAEISIPVRTRSKRGRSSFNPWLNSPLMTPNNKEKKKKKLSHRQINTGMKNSLEKSKLLGIKKCTHCEITKTPQWREGPMGPKTLCNACGVRYRSGRLFPEYRPAASPTYVPSLHSNSHRKVIEMREKAINVKKGTGMNKTCDMQKSLIPKSEFSSLFDNM